MVTGQSLDLTRLKAAYRDGTATVAAVMAEIGARIEAAGEDHVWISRVPTEQVAARAAELDRLAAADPEIRERLPLFGVPFAVKDNIDAAGLATTAACPAYAYDPDADATVVARLLTAGAVLIGKTNLDQFATGLVGVRSPHGVPRNPFDARYIPGGSSSGSAVAVAAGLVSFALGTDTAGSGRVPASFNNLIGLKPSRGLLSMKGVVPACLSLDCVSIFALTVSDAEAVLAVAGGFDPDDPYSRAAPAIAATPGSHFRFGVPTEDEREFFGDSANTALYAKAITALEALGGTAVPFRYAPFNDAAKLLYDGPWVAERLAAIEKLFRDRPEALFPVTRAIIANGDKFSAVDTFKAFYRLAALRRETEGLWRDVDVMVLPTAPSIYTIDEVAADPVALNSRLGHYTNFVNLLDLAALAVPAGFRPDGLPFGITLIAPALHDHALAALGRRFTRAQDLPLGASAHRLPDEAAPAEADDGIPVAVFGAHLSGMPLNHQLCEHGARFLATVTTAPRYRMYEIPGSPARPGIVRVADGAGRGIAAELWSLSPAALGALVAATTPPLSIGTVELADGSQVKGFLCEGAAVPSLRDISDYGGWRRFVAAAG